MLRTKPTPKTKNIKGRPRGTARHFQPEQNRRSKNFNVWRSIRWLRRFTTFDLMATLQQEEQGDSYQRVYAYLKRLQDADYLAGQRRAPKPTIYSLLRDTGPYAPMPQSNGTVFDPNLRKFFGEACQ